MDQDSYRDLKEEIIKFANQPSVRKQLREQIDRFCEMVENRIEIIRPIIKEAYKRHTDPEIRKQAAQKQVDKLKNAIKEYNKPLPNGQEIEFIDRAVQEKYRFLVDEWDKIEKHFNKKKKTPKMAKRIADYNYMRDSLGPMAMVPVSDLLKEEGPPGDGYLFGYENDDYCKETVEGNGYLYWYPSEPPNPIEWFPYFKVCGGKLEFRQMKPDEEFMVKSVTLASIHDEERIRDDRYTSQLIYRNEPYTGQYFDRDEFLKMLWWHFDKPGSKKQTMLELALQNVRDALQKYRKKNKKTKKPLAKTIRQVLHLKTALKSDPVETLVQVNAILELQGYEKTTMDVFKNSPGWKNRHKNQAK